MRLLNVHTLEFSNYYGSVPKYVVASHRWSIDNEAMLGDVRDRCNTHKSGYKKVEGFAKYVRENICYIDWLWIDTCCVNQDSDREVSEAVNSMFRWYAEAELCLVYLLDVDDPQNGDKFRRSDWFRRGWTLQELLAPHTVVFLSQDWKVIGHRGGDGTSRSGFRVSQRRPLEQVISTITAIPERVLLDYNESKNFSIEERVAWMAGRNTTRAEDMSYSLFGIFEVALPVIYGEGADRARRRLLREISEVHSFTGAHASNSDQQADPKEPSKGNASSRKLSSGKPSMAKPSTQQLRAIPLRANTIHEKMPDAVSIAIDDLTDSDHVSKPRKSELCNQNDAVDPVEDRFELELANSAFSSGNNAFDRTDYETAKSDFEDAKTFAMKLQPLECTEIDLVRIDSRLAECDLRLAECALGTNDTSKAEQILVKVLNQTEDLQVQSDYIYQARHLLSQVYVKTGHLDFARSHCEWVYSGRRKILGKEHLLSYQSLALLSRICELQGDTSQARAFLGLIPENLHVSICKPLRALHQGSLRRGRWARRMDIDHGMPLVAFSPDGRLVASHSKGGKIMLLNAANGSEVKVVTPHYAPVFSVTMPVITALAFSPSGRLASASDDCVVRLWEVNKGKATKIWSGNWPRSTLSSYHIGDLAFTADSKLLLMKASHSERASLWDLTTRKKVMQLDTCAHAAISPDGTLAASASSSTMKLCDTRTGRTMKTLVGHSGRVVSVAFSPDGKLVASTQYNDPTIRLWDVATGAQTKCIRPDDSYFDGYVAFSRDGRLIASTVQGSEDGKLLVSLWDVTSGAKVKRFAGFPMRPRRVAFSPDLKLMASAEEGRVMLWDFNCVAVRTETTRKDSKLLDSVVGNRKEDR